jgi:hypothetical protein
VSAYLEARAEPPPSFRQIVQFGLNAPLSFPEIPKIVAEELDKCSLTEGSSAANPVKPAGETMLPRMLLPAHLRDREKR